MCCGRKASEAAPFSGGFEWFYALISVAAFLALWKYKMDIMKVIGACAAVGLVYTYLFEECEMPYELKPLSCNPTGLNGLSEKLIVSHWENNYGGAVKRLNAIEQKLAELQWASAPVFEINGLKREEMIASGSMILHEVYFDSLGGAGGDPGSAIKAAIERDFGSLDAWRTEFTAWARPKAVALVGPC